MKKLSLLALLAGCATVPSPGGHETIACQRYVDDRAPDYTIYSCPRPFPRARPNGVNCAFSTREGSDAKGPYIPCGWTRGFTDLKAKEIFVWDVEGAEALDHEIEHAQGRIHEDD